eukprot:6213051-Pleurochrysis_carterae.AAC.5
MRRARVGPQVRPQETTSRIVCAMHQAQRTGPVTLDRAVCPPRHAMSRARRIGARRERRANEASERVGRCRTDVAANRGGGGSWNNGQGQSPWEVQKRGCEGRVDHVESEARVGAGVANRAEVRRVRDADAVLGGLTRTCNRLRAGDGRDGGEKQGASDGRSPAATRERPVG